MVAIPFPPPPETLSLRAFEEWLRALPPQERLGPNSSLFLDPLARHLRELTGDAYVALPDTLAVWDGYGFACTERTPLWARAVLWTLDHWSEQQQGAFYTAQDVLHVLAHLDEHLANYASILLWPDATPLQEEDDDDEQVTGERGHERPTL